MQYTFLVPYDVFAVHFISRVIPLYFGCISLDIDKIYKVPNALGFAETTIPIEDTSAI